MINCVFCHIAAKQKAHYLYYEDEAFVAFLDRKPFNPGHSLIIPKAHIDYFFDLSTQQTHDILDRARRLEPVLKKVTKAQRIGLLVEGFGVGHAHLHLIPLHNQQGLDALQAHDATDAELAEMFEQLRTALA